MGKKKRFELKLGEVSFNHDPSKKDFLKEACITMMVEYLKKHTLSSSDRQ